VSLPSRLDLPVAVLTFPRLSVVICLRGLLDDIYPVKSARQNLPGKIYPAKSTRRHPYAAIQKLLSARYCACPPFADAGQQYPAMARCRVNH